MPAAPPINPPSCVRPLEQLTGDPGKLSFADIFDLEQIQRIQDAFAKATGVASVILTPEGRFITRPSNFCRLCETIIRRSKKGLARCLHSDIAIGHASPTPIIQPCLSGGLLDAGSNIVIENRHVATWFVGQVRTPTQDIEKMRAYAREIGVAEDEFLRALEEVPAMSMEQFTQVAQALHLVANQISLLALQTIHQAQTIRRFEASQRELRERDHRLAGILETVPIGIIMTVDRVLQEVNEGVCMLTGYSREQLLGKSTRTLYFTDAEFNHVGAIFEKGRKAGAVPRVEVRMRHASGHPLDVYMRTSILRLADGREALIVALLDQTARRRAEEQRHQLEAQLERSHRLESLGVLAGGIAHDFNNILTSILGNVDFALTDLPDNDTNAEILEFLRAVRTNAQRAADLVRQLLAFSRRQVTQPRDMNINTVLTDLKPMLQQLLTESVEIRTNLADKLPAIRMDLSQLEQVIINLVVNARDAMPSGGAMILETDGFVADHAFAAAHPGVHMGNYVRLTVADTGCGIKPEVQEHIFEPFFTTKEIGRGSGLGLAMVYGILQQSGSAITVYSEEGAGTTFRLYFPALQTTASLEPMRRPPAPAVGGKETILLCEDEADILATTKRTLEKAGYNVLPAAHGTTALAIAAKHQEAINLLITDVIMPGIHGRQLADTLRQSRSGLPVLFISGYTANVIAQHGVLEPGVDFLEKPFDQYGLLSKVREILDRNKTKKFKIHAANKG